jgi:HlyD family secretion protein
MESLETVLTVDEADIGALEVGQEATVTLETWPDEEFESEIVKIAPSATTDQSALVSYAVHLTLAEATRPVRAGMTANATLLTAQREDVLLLPSQAIISDRQAGRYYVDLVVDGTQQTAGGDAANDGGTGVAVERVEVTIGMRDDENTQILEGLQEGDRVRMRTAAPLSNPFEDPNQGDE